MFKSQIRINIPTPCQEHWGNMQPNENGRFCQNCAATVIDFTKFTDAELINHLQQSSGKTCGRLSLQQLNRNLIKTNKGTSKIPYQLMAGALLLSMPFASTQAQISKETETTVTTLCFPNHKITIPEKPTTNNSKTATKIVKGVVRELPSNNLVPAAKVTVVNTNIVTYTNMDGEFEISLPDSLQNTSFTLSVVSFGYMETISNIPANSISENQVILLTLEEFIIIGRISIEKTKRWWQFWK